MARRDSLGSQFNEVIGKRIRQMAYAKTLELMKRVCHDALISLEGNAKFWNITGNTITSLAVGVFYKGKRVYAEYSADEMWAPTMPTLKKGQAYPLSEYYDGGSVEGKPYTGEVGHGGQWGPTLGKSRLSRVHSNARDTWNLVAICPVEYAQYNARIFKMMYETYQGIPGLFEANVFYVRSSGIE